MLRSVVLFVLVAGCSGPVEMNLCTPGETHVCACTSGAMGAQLCSREGTFNACTCDDAGAPLEDAGRPDAGLDDDAGASSPDAGHARDAGSELEDAGAELVDAGPPEECDLVTQEGCGLAFACRRSDGPGPTYTTPPDGPPHCEPAGTLVEWDQSRSTCRDTDGRDLCRRGLFCLNSGVCVRFCDPAGEACPDTPLSHAPQRCGSNDEAFDPYCSPFF